MDGITFASRGEARHYAVLKQLEKLGEITDLELQPKFELFAHHKDSGKPIKVCSYVADFAFWDVKKRVRRIQDYKGFVPQLYRLKKKMMLACHGIEIEEVRS